MSKNLIAATAEDLYEQIQKIKTAKGAELDREAKRMEAIAIGAEGIGNMADKQIKILYATGFLPDENILIDKDETKLVNAKRNLLPKPGNKGLLMSEFDS